MFEDQGDRDLSEISQDTPTFAPDELFTIAEFVALTIDGWQAAGDALREEGLPEAADEIDEAVDLLKNTYPVNELINLEQLSGLSEPATDTQQ